MVRKMVLVFSLTEAGEQQIGWVLQKYQATMGAVGKACHNFAKLPCQNRQYNYQIYWTQFYQGNNFYNNYNKK